MLSKNMKFMITIPCVSLILTLLTSTTVNNKALANDVSHQDMALRWLEKQFDQPEYLVGITLSKEYPVEAIQHLEGNIEIDKLQGYTTSDVPSIQTDGEYATGYLGEISGTWSNIQDTTNYTINVYDETDIKYLIGTASLQSNGTWTIGEKNVRGKIFVTLVDENHSVIAKSSKIPLQQKINEYEVWVYSITDQAYLQTKLPINKNGTFTTDYAKDFSGLHKGKKEARLVRVSDGKVISTTDIPKFNLIRSYFVPVDDPVNTLGIDRRSWLYDNALAVFTFSMAGDQSRASSILSTLAQLQNNDGSLSFSYDVFSGPLDETKRSGAIAWAGDAAVKYEKTFGDETYRTFAIAIAEYLLTQQDPMTGSIKGGPDVNWYSTEHNIDAYFFFRNLGNLTSNSKYLKAASAIENALLTYHWNEEEQRFNQGINDSAAALDTNSWGSIFLEAIGRKDLSQLATEYLKHFEVRDVPMKLSNTKLSYNQTYTTDTLVSGYKPYSKGYSEPPHVVWTEGTWGVINLLIRQGKDLSSLVNSMFTMQEADSEGGLVYANAGIGMSPYEFHVWPSVAGTAWQYITLKDPRGIWDDNETRPMNPINDLLKKRLSMFK